MKIARWFIDGISLIIYFFIANILKGLYSITITVISLLGLIIVGFVLRALLVVRPINNMVDYVNVLEKNNLEVE